MSQRIGEVAINVGANVAPLRRDLKAGATSLQKFGAAARKQAVNIAKIASAAAAAGVAIVAHLVNKARKAIDEQAKLAQQLRTTSASMATLERAGELTGVGMDKITTSARQMDVALGRAVQGGNAQAAAFDRLGLSAERVAAMPLDERISTINRALRENVSETERAAVAAEIFGTRNAAAMQMLDTSALAEGRRQAELFGTALTDVDAAKVEQANDSFATISMAIDGLIKQFTVQVAPALRAVGDMFLDAAEDAGGMGNIASAAFEKVVSAVGFALDAMRGVQVAAKTVQLAFSGLGTGVVKIFTTITKGWTHIVDMIASGAESLVGGINKLLAPFGKSIPTELFDSIREGTAETREVMDEAAETAAASTRRIASELHETMIAQMPSEILREKLAEYQEISQEAAEAEIERRKEQQGLILETEEEGHEAEADLLKDHQERLKAIRDSGGKAMVALAQKHGNAERAVALSSVQGIASDLASMNKTMFNEHQAFAVSDALVSTYQGIASALKLPFPANIAAAARTASTGFAAVNNIKSTGFGSKSSKGSGGASGGGGSLTGSEQQQQPQRNVADVTFNVSGSGMMRDLARQLVEPMNDLRRDGYEIGNVGVA